MTSSSIQLMSLKAKALSEEVRIRMLLCLQGGPLSFQQLCDIFDLAPSTLSKHIHILENAGLVESSRQGRWRLFQWPRKIEPSSLVPLLTWIQEAAKDDPILASDAAKRAVSVQNNPAPLPLSERIRVLFLCTGNSCRSQMAEALLRQKGGNRVEVASAGVSPRDIHPLTLEVMAEKGVDISAQKPQNIMHFIGNTHFDYLITVCPLAEHQTPVFPGITRRLHWPLPDPAKARGAREQKMKVFRKVRDELENKIETFLKEHEKGR